MTTSLKKMMARLPADRRKKVEARVAELITELPDRPPVVIQERKGTAPDENGARAA